MGRSSRLAVNLIGSFITIQSGIQLLLVSRLPTKAVGGESNCKSVLCGISSPRFATTEPWISFSVVRRPQSVNCWRDLASSYKLGLHWRWFNGWSWWWWWTIGRPHPPQLFMCTATQMRRRRSWAVVDGQWRAANQSTYWGDTPWRPHVPNEHINFLIDESGSGRSIGLPSPSSGRWVSI